MFVRIRARPSFNKIIKSMLYKRHLLRWERHTSNIKNSIAFEITHNNYLFISMINKIIVMMNIGYRSGHHNLITFYKKTTSYNISIEYGNCLLMRGTQLHSSPYYIHAFLISKYWFEIELEAEECRQWGANEQILMCWMTTIGLLWLKSRRMGSLATYRPMAHLLRQKHTTQNNSV